jgi:Reverse transcriptase (RNA-dependent DNA polymerase)
MEVLERQFACRDALKDWFHSYLIGRTQFCYAGTSSVSTGFICRVPQGSINGPCQFTAHTEDVQDVIHMPHHLYADDTQILAKNAIQSLSKCCCDLDVGVQRGDSKFSNTILTRPSSSISVQQCSCSIF